MASVDAGYAMGLAQAAAATTSGRGVIMPETEITTGVLYGVGTGPGDPQLVTRRAWHLIETADVIAYPAPDSGASFARSIVADAIRPQATEIAMIVPMKIPPIASGTITFDRAIVTTSGIPLKTVKRILANT